MLEQGFFNHTDPQGREPVDRVQRVSKRHWVAVGENIAAGFPTAYLSCARWNKAHLDNMLRRTYTHIGAGYARARGLRPLLRAGVRDACALGPPGRAPGADLLPLGKPVASPQFRLTHPSLLVGRSVSSGGTAVGPPLSSSATMVR